MTAACDLPSANNRAALNRRASNAALRRRPRAGLVMPQHRIVLDERHHFISRDSLAWKARGDERIKGYDWRSADSVSLSDGVRQAYPRRFLMPLRYRLAGG